ncbi:AAA family ATPase [Cellulosimicrobium cellulans]|uniref:AAA family ATPase n=1 Tax=Cellulosimicrobium cellulans TaxID=1710 RepID=UPI001D168552|nr:ATP-binding protein [Cellulosimicrobium cellulans]
MDEVILMCGPAGSGKSTYARGLEAQGYVVLSFDGEAWALGHRTHPIDDDARSAVNRALREKLVAGVKQGQHVVVDSSFWSRASRDEFRRLLAPCGVVPVVYYLDTRRSILLSRLAQRENSGPDDISVSRERAIAYIDGFETPTPDEGPLRIVHGDRPDMTDAAAGPADDLRTGPPDPGS